jgi:hypothetical protein
MTSDFTAGNAKNYSPSDLSCRLWLSDHIALKKPNTILVHGAVIPPGHIREAPNYCFRQLAPSLHSELHHNVWEFEYAKELFVHHLTHRDRYFNYQCLTTCGEELINAIVRVTKCNPDGDINIIAHSMVGLIARYAAQNIQDA